MIIDVHDGTNYPVPSYFRGAAFEGDRFSVLGVLSMTYSSQVYITLKQINARVSISFATHTISSSDVSIQRHPSSVQYLVEIQLNLRYAGMPDDILFP